MADFDAESQRKDAGCKSQMRSCSKNFRAATWRRESTRVGCSSIILIVTQLKTSEHWLENSDYSRKGRRGTNYEIRNRETKGTSSGIFTSGEGDWSYTDKSAWVRRGVAREEWRSWLASRITEIKEWRICFDQWGNCRDDTVERTEA